MPEFLRDPIWQFVGVTVACTCGLVPIILSVFFFIFQHQYKSLAYEVLAETDLITIKEEVKGKLQVLYETVPVDNVSLVIMKIVNNGSVPLESSDFENPIIVSLNDNAKILDAQIIETVPGSLQPILSHQESSLAVEPLLLNNGDYITIKAVVTHYKSPPEVKARIVGVKNVSRISLPETESAYESIPIPITIIAAGVAGLGFYLLIAFWLSAFPPELPLEIQSMVQSIFGITIGEFFQLISNGIICILAPFLILIGLLLFIDRKHYTAKGKRALPK